MSLSKKEREKIFFKIRRQIQKVHEFSVSIGSDPDKDPRKVEELHSMLKEITGYDDDSTEFDKLLEYYFS